MHMRNGGPGRAWSLDADALHNHPIVKLFVSAARHVSATARSNRPDCLPRADLERHADHLPDSPVGDKDRQFDLHATFEGGGLVRNSICLRAT